MDFISVYGQILSEKTGVKHLACNGMIRLAFRDASLDPSTSNFKEYKEVFTKYLKSRLVKSNIDNSDEIVNLLMAKLIDNQILFTISP
ncbi:MAG: hypothetical protein ACFFBP_05160 [Promethearchaeota archaeon]